MRYGAGFRSGIGVVERSVGGFESRDSYFSLCECSLISSSLVWQLGIKAVNSVFIAGKCAFHNFDFQLEQLRDST